MNAEFQENGCDNVAIFHVLDTFGEALLFYTLSNAEVCSQERSAFLVEAGGLVSLYGDWRLYVISGRSVAVTLSSACAWVAVWCTAKGGQRNEECEAKRFAFQRAQSFAAGPHYQRRQ